MRSSSVVSYALDEKKHVAFDRQLKGSSRIVIDIVRYKCDSLIGKILQSLVHKLIFSLVSQIRFKKSIVSNKIEYITDMYKKLTKKMHAVYTDFKKPFDLFRHDILLKNSHIHACRFHMK